MDVSQPSKEKERMSVRQESCRERREHRFPVDGKLREVSQSKGLHAVVDHTCTSFIK